MAFKFVEGEVDFQLGLGVVRRDSPVEVRILAALGQGRVGGRWRHGDFVGALVDAERGLGCPAADVTQHHVDPFGDKFGGSVGGDFGFADVVFHQQFHLFTHHTALGVDLFHHDLGRMNARNAV